MSGLWQRTALGMGYKRNACAYSHKMGRTWGGKGHKCAWSSSVDTKCFCKSLASRSSLSRIAFRSILLMISSRKITMSWDKYTMRQGLLIQCKRDSQKSRGSRRSNRWTSGAGMRGRGRRGVAAGSRGPGTKIQWHDCSKRGKRSMTSARRAKDAAYESRAPATSTGVDEKWPHSTMASGIKSASWYPCRIARKCANVAGSSKWTSDRTAMQMSGCCISCARKSGTCLTGTAPAPYQSK